MIRRNVLIFHMGALGDFVLSWPLALALGRVYAQSRVIYVTHAQKGALAERVLRLESHDAEAGWHALFSEGTRELPERAGALLNGAHAIYTFLAPPQDWLANVNRLNPQAKVVSLLGRPPDDYTQHSSDWLVERLKDHPVERAATEQILRSIADRGIGFKRASGQDIVIHPGSGSPEKCWPLENFIELAERLNASGKRVRFVVGEVERERWPSSHFAAMARVGEVRDPKTYLDLLAELGTAGVFVGNDSGPGHLAGMIGVPTLSIFERTSPERWKPLGPNVRVLQGESSARVSVEQVIDALG